MIVSRKLLAILVLAAAAAPAAAAFAQPRIAPLAVRPVAPAAVAASTAPAASVSPAALRAGVAPRVHGMTFDENRLRLHVIRPAHTIGVSSDLGRDEGRLVFKGRPIVVTPQGPHLDVNAFGQALHAALKDQVNGYVMRLRKNGQTIYTLQWNWAKTPQDGSVGWTPDRQMHVASVSKLITAMAMTKLLDANNISYDAPIIGYLPTYWSKGPNIDKITFRQLMTHTSGFAEGNTDYISMMNAVAAGVSTNSGMADYLGHYHYRNMNFGLCRILIATINGNVPKDTNFGTVPGFTGLNDALWDALTIAAYDQYEQQKVFAPAGVTTATLDHPPGAALAYRFPVTDAGWNSGDLETVAGGAGWHMSADQLLDVMGTFRRKGTIMSPAKAAAMLDASFGIDMIADTPAGKLYNKNGLWHDAKTNGRTEQSLAYFLPEGMELVVLTNSPIGNPEKFFRDVVTQIYVDNIK